MAKTSSVLPLLIGGGILAAIVFSSSGAKASGLPATPKPPTPKPPTPKPPSPGGTPPAQSQGGDLWSTITGQSGGGTVAGVPGPNTVAGCNVDPSMPAQSRADMAALLTASPPATDDELEAVAQAFDVAGWPIAAACLRSRKSNAFDPSLIGL